ncbi:hypothetical protein [Porphyromonas macacae]|uniref:hypothetical protein n=1 Tax=Porphyromonas macacae TaxID=28115 RepID=UPI00359F147E
MNNPFQISKEASENEWLKTNIRKKERDADRSKKVAMPGLQILSAMNFYSLPDGFSTKLTWIFIFLNKNFEPSGNVFPAPEKSRLPVVRISFLNRR